MQIATYNEMLGMPRMNGSSASLGNFAAKTGGALGAWLTSILLKISGYISTTADVTVTQPDSALGMIRFVFAGLPGLLLFVIIFSCFAFSKLEHKTAAYEEEKAKAAAPAEN